MAEFLEIISRSYSGASVRLAQDFLAAFDLPVPAEGEFYHTNEHSPHISKQIIFIESHGIAIRFYDSYFIPTHDYILQPVAKCELGNIDIDIVPIIPTGISKENLVSLTKNLAEDGIEWGDRACHNAGYISQRAGVKNFPVIVDLCESIIAGCRPGYLGGKSDENFECKVQKEVFAPLLEAGSGLFGDGFDWPTKEASSLFLNAAQKFSSFEKRACSPLQASFRRVTDLGQTRKACEAARRYSQRLELMWN